LGGSGFVVDDVDHELVRGVAQGARPEQQEGKFHPARFQRMFSDLADGGGGGGRGQRVGGGGGGGYFDNWLLRRPTSVHDLLLVPARAQRGLGSERGGEGVLLSAGSRRASFRPGKKKRILVPTGVHPKPPPRGPKETPPQHRGRRGATCITCLSECL